jgi:hypothetical protein
MLPVTKEIKHATQRVGEDDGSSESPLYCHFRPCYRSPARISLVDGSSPVITVGLALLSRRKCKTDTPIQASMHWGERGKSVTGPVNCTCSFERDGRRCWPGFTNWTLPNNFSSDSSFFLSFSSFFHLHMSYCSFKQARTASSRTPLSNLAPISSFMHVALILQRSLEIDTQSPC